MEGRSPRTWYESDERFITRPVFHFPLHSEYVQAQVHRNAWPHKDDAVKQVPPFYICRIVEADSGLYPLVSSSRGRLQWIVAGYRHVIKSIRWGAFTVCEPPGINLQLRLDPACILSSNAQNEASYLESSSLTGTADFEQLSVSASTTSQL